MLVSYKKVVDCHKQAALTLLSLVRKPYWKREKQRYDQNSCKQKLQLFHTNTNQNYNLIYKIIGSKQKFWILGTETFSWSSSQRRGPTPRGDYLLLQYDKSLGY